MSSHALASSVPGAAMPPTGSGPATSLPAAPPSASALAASATDDGEVGAVLAIATLAITRSPRRGPGRRGMKRALVDMLVSAATSSRRESAAFLFRATEQVRAVVVQTCGEHNHETISIAQIQNLLQLAIAKAAKKLAAFCATCGNPTDASKRCGGGGKVKELEPVFYCSKECQRTHWKSGHKDVCGSVSTPAAKKQETERSHKNQSLIPQRLRDSDIANMRRTPMWQIVLSKEMTGYKKPFLVLQPVWQFFKVKFDPAGVLKNFPFYKARISGLKKDSQLNGKEAPILGLDHQRLRVKVQITATKTVLIRPRNFTVVIPKEGMKEARRVIKSVRGCIKKWFDRERTGNAQFDRRDIGDLCIDAAWGFWLGIPGIESYDPLSPAHQVRSAAGTVMAEGDANLTKWWTGIRHVPVHEDERKIFVANG